LHEARLLEQRFATDLRLSCGQLSHFPWSVGRDPLL